MPVTVARRGSYWRGRGARLRRATTSFRYQYRMRQMASLSCMSAVFRFLLTTPLDLPDVPQLGSAVLSPKLGRCRERDEKIHSKSRENQPLPVPGDCLALRSLVPPLLAAVYWARAPRVVLPDRALCLPTFCHSLLTVNKSSSSSSSPLHHAFVPRFMW